MKISLNLATEPLLNNRPFYLASALLGIAALVAAAFLTAKSIDNYQSTRAMRTRAGQLSSDIRALEAEQRRIEGLLRRPDIARVFTRAAFLNGLIGLKSFSWTQIFMDLEKELPGGVHVSTIIPRQEASGRVQVKLTVVARDAASVIELLRRLEKSPAFQGVEVQSETAPSGRPGEEIRVELTAGYGAS